MRSFKRRKNVKEGEESDNSSRLFDKIDRELE